MITDLRTWFWVFGPGTLVIDFRFWNLGLFNDSQVLGFGSLLPGPWSLIPVYSVVNTKFDKKLLQSLTDIIKSVNYYKVWKKDLTKCDRYYKMQRFELNVTFEFWVYGRLPFLKQTFTIPDLGFSIPISIHLAMQKYSQE